MQRLNDLNGDEYTNNEYIPYNYLSPDRIDYIAAWTFGGVGRFIGDLSDVAYKAATDPEAIELTDYPIVGQFYKEPNKYKDQTEFYENSERYQSLLAQLKNTKLKDRPNLVEKGRSPYYDPQLQLSYRAANQRLRIIRQAEENFNKTIDDPAALRRALEKTDADKQKVFDQFNRDFRAAKKKAGD